MLKNKRPYTNENGHVDAGFITDHPAEEREIVAEWIAAMIRPAKSRNRHRTSYGIKHILQGDTGIYLTNNEFKDAMLQAGYEPCDQNELNWTYKISNTSNAFNITTWRKRNQYPRGDGSFWRAIS